jgi:hypothetical protein
MQDKVSVTVQYAGKNDFTEEVPAGEELQAVKVRVMKAFELNAGDASRYVLQFGGADVKEHVKVGTFGTTVVLTLALADEVAKG